MATSTWTNVTGVYSAPNNLLSLYVNGLLVATTSVTGSTMLTTVGSSSIAADLRGSVTDFFNGTLDGVRIYSKELTAREVYNLAALGQAWLRRP
jgi:hypothetical protein